MPMCQNHVTDFAPVGKCPDCDTDRVELAYWEDKVASLTIQRDAAEARSRELASDTVEALAILRAFVAAEDTQMVKAKGSGAAHLGFGMYSDAMDRARKLVGTP
jgi:hypothetical protein